MFMESTGVWLTSISRSLCSPPVGLCGIVGVRISQADVLAVAFLVIVHACACCAVQGGASRGLVLLLVSVAFGGTALSLWRATVSVDEADCLRAANEVRPCPLGECAKREPTAGTARGREERANLLAVARSNTAQWTLVLVMGQLRTMAFTAESLVANILLPNEPCHVSVALDAPQRLTENLRSALSPWLVSERSGAPPCHRAIGARPGVRATRCAHIEFRLALAALDEAMARPLRHRPHYHFMISVRTDVLVATPICVRCAHGAITSPAFLALYKRFRRVHARGVPAGNGPASRGAASSNMTTTSSATSNVTATGELDLRYLTTGSRGGARHDRVLQWLLSAGSPTLLHAREKVPRERRSEQHGGIQSPWCPAAVPPCVQRGRVPTWRRLRRRPWRLAARSWSTPCAASHGVTAWCTCLAIRGSALVQPTCLLSTSATPSNTMAGRTPSLQPEALRASDVPPRSCGHARTRGGRMAAP